MSRVKLCATQSRAIKDRILIRLTLLVQGFVYFYYIIQILGCCDLKECNLQYIKRGVSDCCLTLTQWFVQSYHGENKLMFNDEFRFVLEQHD
jgi:hypothetical protein